MYSIQWDLPWHTHARTFLYIEILTTLYQYWPRKTVHSCPECREGSLGRGQNWLGWLSGFSFMQSMLIITCVQKHWEVLSSHSCTCDLQPSTITARQDNCWKSSRFLAYKALEALLHTTIASLSFLQLLVFFIHFSYISATVFSSLSFHWKLKALCSNFFSCSSSQSCGVNLVFTTCSSQWLRRRSVVSGWRKGCYI